MFDDPGPDPGQDMLLGPEFEDHALHTFSVEEMG
jgi:hypothetical protein